ncbi:hypothetical protein [Aurantibacillus circumpalustris]|uniref:hypothetical protein n=1 Tax=Aurantibacillus circumpalustris TaxID=3036359 RepID=UPI00295B0EBC|nr:hypothetical protein [Aurantibacillus circumpalustris]
MNEILFKINLTLKAGLLWGAMGALFSIALIKLTHNGSYLMCLPALVCMVISVYMCVSDLESNYFHVFSSSLYTALVTLVFSYLILTFFYALTPILTFSYLLRLSEILIAGIVCSAFFARSRY